MYLDMSDEERAAYYLRGNARWARISSIQAEKARIQDEANAQIRRLDAEEAQLRREDEEDAGLKYSTVGLPSNVRT